MLAEGGRMSSPEVGANVCSCSRAAAVFLFLLLSFASSTDFEHANAAREFGQTFKEEAKTYVPKVVMVDENNHPINVRGTEKEAEIG